MLVFAPTMALLQFMLLLCLSSSSLGFTLKTSRISKSRLIFKRVATTSTQHQENLSDKAMKKKLDVDFLRIGLPSLVQFAAGPLCNLVDSM